MPYEHVMDMHQRYKLRQQQVMSLINAYFAKDVLSSPIKASVAPPTAVFLQPKRSVNMLTTGEQKKIMPMARAPTQAGEEIDVIVRNIHIH